VTFTVTIQLPEAGIVPPERLSEFPPLAAVTVPPQVVDGEALAVFTIPAGYVSVKAAPVIAIVFELVRVMVIVAVLFTGMEAGLNPLVVVGGVIAVSVAEAAAMEPMSVDTVPVLFKYVPATVAVTGTTMEQLLDAGTVPPERASELPPLAMVTVQPQVFVVGAAAVFFMLVEG
jgi:hypothetical protein